MNYTELIASLAQAFVDQDKYFFDKHVPEFNKEGKFLGDYFSQLAVEPLGDKPPRFYHTFSPFDVISNKAPHRAVVFEAGKMLLDIDFEEYVSLRTAAMSTLVLKALGIETLKDKKVLLFGSGRIATQSVKVLASELGLKTIGVMNQSGDLSGIRKVAGDVVINSGTIDNIGWYDVIICHTQAAGPVISKEQLKDIKKGAILASFITSTEHGELPDEIYDSSKATVITDWQQTILGAKDLKRAVDAHLVQEEDLIYIKDLLSNKKIDQNKQYTVYRSAGTPVQNLAILKLLV